MKCESTVSHARRRCILAARSVHGAEWRDAEAAALVALALDLHPREATLAVVDLNGRLVLRSTVPLSSDPAASTQLILDGITRVRGELGRMSIEGIGISFPGRVDPRTDRVLFAPNHISVDPDGPECACGRRGCWEVFASCRAALVFQGSNRA
jgi:predicted NBD/HSP70 family sugar kinase